ncbi:MAG: hypothetical protein EB127_27365 [Alphaproteobacteria bacterium]|nr:hypothetical protein [Alphaproteobacteria bacterium]
MGLDMENEIRSMRKESIQAAIMKKETAALDTLSLNELRAIDDDDEIPEPKTDAAAAPGAVPGEMPGGGGLPGGLDLGGLGGPPPGVEPPGGLGGPPPGGAPPPGP